MEKINIARHPILDSEQRLFGYELQFRDPDRPSTDPTALAREFPTTLVDTVETPEFTKLLGNGTAFIPVTPNFVEKGFSLFQGQFFAKPAQITTEPCRRKKPLWSPCTTRSPAMPSSEKSKPPSSKTPTSVTSCYA